MAMTSRSTTRERKLTTAPSRHISVRMVSPGKDRRGEAAGERRELFRIVAAHGFQHRVAGDAEGAEAVQDRALEAGRLREGGLGMQRIVVAAQPIDQRHFRARAEIADRIGRALGIGCGGGVSRGGPPKPPSPRQKLVCVTVAIRSPVALSVILRSV